MIFLPICMCSDALVSFITFLVVKIPSSMGILSIVKKKKKKNGIDGDPNEDPEDSMFQAERQVKIDRSDRNTPRKGITPDTH